MAGLKIAMGNGSTLESAKRSFMNAGYNPQEVEEAVRLLSSDGGAVSIAEARELPAVPTSRDLPALPGREKRMGWLIALVIFAIMVLLGAISYLVYVLAF